ncbi:lipase 3-like [Tetranychus urticae]|uniref:Partial AB-hydrolase lipase domain-containing protein n=1 Tax=Tetranychus urticae TaxID=32264 RepID=T1KPH9_TETUR|nr:lipase 3-like [Tetranychus urticae]
MGSNMSQFFQLSIILSFLLSLTLSSSYSSVPPQNLPPPENSIFAQEQLYIAPFKKSHDEALTCGQLIVSRGFKYERHFVTTEDGYILTLYRIINPNAQAARGSKLIPVLLVHGIFTSCSSWMINGFDGFIEPWVDGKPPNVRSNSLAFVLGNGEFDVWIANNRGTSYSRNHTRLDPDTDSEFWDFSFAEMGEYDTPAMVDYIIDKTDHDKIVWIGYSRGTQQMFVQLAENPAFAEKLYLNINISPIAFYGDAKGLGSVIPNERLATRALENYEGPLPPFLPEFDAGLTYFCSAEISQPICIEVYSYLFGPNRRMINKEIFQVITSQIDSTSNKDTTHDLQSMRYDQIRKFDYGKKMNQEKYGSDEPPKYQFERIPKYNLVLISGLNDYLADSKDVQKLRNILSKGNSTKFDGPCPNSNNRPYIDHVITDPYWSHTDIIFGNRAYEYAHSVILDIMRDYFSQTE